MHCAHKDEDETSKQHGLSIVTRMLWSESRRICCPNPTLMSEYDTSVGIPHFRPSPTLLSKSDCQKIIGSVKKQNQETAEKLNKNIPRETDHPSSQLDELVGMRAPH